MNKTAVFTVIFPGNLKYFPAFLDSLRQQSSSAFDLLLMVDSIPDIEEHLTPYRDFFPIIALNSFGSISMIRQKALEWLKDLKYDLYIFADSDDIMGEDRVRSCVESLSAFPVVVNDVVPFFNQYEAHAAGFWCNRMKSGEVFSAHDIQDCNFVGLGNTSTRKDALRMISIPEDLIAVDWFLFYQLLQRQNGIFLHTGKVFYRQHDNNLAGVAKVTEEKLKKVAKSKIRHYTSLLKKYPVVEHELLRHVKLSSRLEDPTFAATCVVELENININYFWWEETQYIHE